MSRTAPSAEWYADGLRFSCSQCGNCCTGDPGAVWYTPAEAVAMAKQCGLSLEVFEAKYTRSIHGRRSLNEQQTSFGYDCTFLNRSVPGKATCDLYHARPSQCRTWPFWPNMLASKAAWERAKRETPCLGMNQGPLIPVESIRIQRDADLPINSDKPW